MKKLFLIFLFYPIISFSQTSSKEIVNSSNYYEKLTHNPMSRINWLRECDVVPIIIDELEKNGYSFAFIHVGLLIDIGTGEKLVIHVAYCYQDTVFGFIYKGTHEAFIKKTRRNLMLQQDEIRKSITQYSIVNDTVDNYLKEPQRNKIKSVPNNIFVLDENCYFYEEDIDDNNIKYPLSREIITEILRQDIRTFLKRLKFK